MAIIKPVSELRNNFNEISAICHEQSEPVYLTKNGRGDMVVMSLANYESQQRKIELYQKILEAETEAKSTAARFSHADVMNELRLIVEG